MMAAAARAVRRSRGGNAPRVVAITGAARGIGRATAEAFLSRGSSVAIGDLDADLARSTAAELSAAYPRCRVVGLGLDVACESQIRSFLTEATDELGQVEVLVNNAGIMPTGALADETEAFTRKILEVNLKGVIGGTRVGLTMLPSSGAIVNIASQAALLPAPALATYGASKAAVSFFGHAMRRELEGTAQPHVCTVLPGIVRTELSAGTKLAGYLEPVFVVNPDDVAEGVVRGVLQRRHRVYVPAPMGTMIRVLAVVPYPVRRAIERALGLDSAFAEADPESRRRYHARLSGSDGTPAAPHQTDPTLATTGSARGRGDDA